MFLSADLCVKIQFKWEICDLPFHMCLGNTPELMFIDPSTVSFIMDQNFLSLCSFQGSHFPSVKHGNSISLRGSVECGVVKINLLKKWPNQKVNHFQQGCDVPSCEWVHASLESFIQSEPANPAMIFSWNLAGFVGQLAVPHGPGSGVDVHSLSKHMAGWRARQEWKISKLGWLQGSAGAGTPGSGSYWGTGNEPAAQASPGSQTWARRASSAPRSLLTTSLLNLTDAFTFFDYCSTAEIPMIAVVIGRIKLSLHNVQRVKDSGGHLHVYMASGRCCQLLCLLQDTKLCDLLADEQEEFLGSVWLLLRTSFWSIFQPPGLLLSQETDKGDHEHRIKKRPEYSCAPNSWELAREEKNLKYFLSGISLLSSIFLLRVDNWFKAAPTPHARPCTPSALSWCKPWADGAVQWKIRSPRKYRAKNKTPSSRKLHGLFQDKMKNWDPWAKIRILLQSGVFHFYELPRSFLIEETSIPSQLKAHLICCLSVHWSAFSRLPRDCSLLN